MNIDELIDYIKNQDGNIDREQEGIPIVNRNHIVPEDLRRFYSLCGGLTLGSDSDFPAEVLPPQQVVRANPILFGELYGTGPIDSISENWYLIARYENDDYITIDFSDVRLGWCYNSFFGYHANPGYCKILAHSFTELLSLLAQNPGGVELPDADYLPDYGDAYSPK